MQTFKKIMKTIFGNATPAQIFLACVFGSMLGFLPSFSHSPFMYTLLIFLILILRINLGFAVIVYIVTKILSFIIEPLSFHLGVGLLNGFTQPLFKSMINTPVLAYGGFEYYLLTGGLTLGLIIGIILGIAIAWVFKSVRTKMANVQQGSELYNKMVNKLWMKILTWVLLGKAANKVDWVKLRDKKFRQPFRILGVILVAIIIALLFIFQSVLQSKMVTNILKTQLEKVNGATVDLDHVKVNLAEAKLSVQGIAFANPDNLKEDRFYAKELTTQLNITELLTKRLVIKSLIIDKAETNHPRQTTGKLYAPKSKAEPSSQPIDITPQKTDAKIEKFQIDKYVEDAKKLHSYQDQIKRVINLVGGDKEAKQESTPSESSQTPADNSIDEQVRVYGYANVADNALIDNTPTLTIQSLEVKELSSKQFAQTLHITAKNIATEPSLLTEATAITVESSDKSFYASLSDKHKAGVENTLSFKVNNLDAEPILKQIKFKDDFKVNAKTFDANANGTWSYTNSNDIAINLPTTVTFHNLVISSKKFKNDMDSLSLNTKVTNTLTNPVIEFDKDQLQDVLLNAGISQAKEQLQKNLGDKLKDKLPFSF